VTVIASINEIEYHRNGVGGEGFYAIRFTNVEEFEGGLPPMEKTPVGTCYAQSGVYVCGKKRGHTFGHSWEGVPQPEPMLAIVFESSVREQGEAGDGFINPRIAVFAEDKLPDVRFGHNSWRGDNFWRDLYEAIKARD
jgi:hypothetical protein